MMSEHTPKQPLNNSEHTAPDYSALSSNAAENSSAGYSVPEYSTTGYREATAGYVYPSAQQSAPVRPRALIYVMWCVAVMIILGEVQKVQVALLNESATFNVDTLTSIIISELLKDLPINAVYIFVLWRLWKGRNWAYILTLVCCILWAVGGLIGVITTFIFSNHLMQLLNEPDAWGSGSLMTTILLNSIVGLLNVPLYLCAVFLLMRRSVRAYTDAVSKMRMKELEQGVAEGNQKVGEEQLKGRENLAEPVDEGHVASHQGAGAETRARLEEAQAHREEEEANRRAEEAVAQQYETARRKAGRKKPRKEQRGYKDTSVYTEEGYRLN